MLQFHKQFFRGETWSCKGGGGGGGGGMVLRRGIPSPTYPIPLPYETLHAHLYGIPLFVAAVMGMEKEFLSMGV